MLCHEASAQQHKVHEFKISYPINRTELHENYQNNPKALKIIREQFRKSPKIDSIVIYSFASPEGPYAFNTYLARERGNTARRYLIESIPSWSNFPDSLIIVKPTSENWEGLKRMVEKGYPYPDKNEILQILDRTDVSQDTKKLLLKELNDGEPWKYITSHYLPKLRYAVWVAEWVYVNDSIPEISAAAFKPKFTKEYAPLSFPHIQVKPVQSDTTKILFALKTNLLYDAISWLNYSLEFPVYKNDVSLLLYHQFPWWTWGQSDNEFCVRYLSVGGELRWWINPPDRFQGHFLGVYGESGKYDFEFERRICYQGEFSNFGVSYGYSKPVGKKKKVNLELSASVGYANLAYRGFDPTDDYGLLIRDPEEVGRWHYFGPTKLQVQLVVPIRVKCSKKGGEL